ncbi:hypothetical protein [Paenibacillus lutrae]|uniref:Uncharacterized protein n=1 Tax=Paenibacillus lutrae TaxID=2078573 RepID=A0A7X3FIM1_9BACL|nr:hypothetical protein [Paenibacillus lutrae]MVP00360.1 hypothetical protein [Paenibacillus lutrae]
MKREELESEFEHRLGSIRADNDRIQWPAAMIEYHGEKGIALMVGENLATGTWLSGDIVVHWENGKHTMLPDEFTLIKENVWLLI